MMEGKRVKLLDFDETFHIIHKAISLINMNRPENERFIVLDKEMGMATEIIWNEDVLEESG